VTQTKSFCNRCNQFTNHEIIAFTKYRNSSNDGNDFWVDYSYSLLQCSGCEDVSLKETSLFSEDAYVDDLENLSDSSHKVIFYPPRNQNRINKHISYYKLPPIIRGIYEETINAYNSDLFILTAIGIRAIIESFCIDKSISKGSLPQKIQILNDKGFISKGQKVHLGEIKFLGDEGAHKLRAYSEGELSSAIILVTAVLESNYFHPELFQKIKNRKKI
jgi:hypothetical protein